MRARSKCRAAEGVSSTRQRARRKLHIEAVVTKVVRWLFVIVGALLGMVTVYQRILTSVIDKTSLVPSQRAAANNREAAWRLRTHSLIGIGVERREVLRAPAPVKNASSGRAACPLRPVGP